MKKVNLEEFHKYYGMGLDDTAISKYLEVSSSCIHYIRKKLDLPKHFKYTTTVSEEDYMRLYNQGMNDRDITKELGVGTADTRYIKEKLKIGNNSQTRFFFTEEQEQIIVGGLLGDSHLRKQYKTPMLTFAHSLAQEDYAKWKEEKLGKKLMIGSMYTDNYDSRTGKCYQRYDVYSTVTTSLNRFYAMFYDSNKVKHVTREQLDILTPLGIAVWFMDDGYRNGNGGLSIATNSFTNEERHVIIQWFKEKYNIKATQHSSGITYLGVESAKIFVNLIQEYIHPSLKYKISIVLNKQEELLENLEVDNQQPSLTSNSFEGSTTNS